MSRLEGKVVLITGGARGMGAEHARSFVAEGAKVMITDILVDEGKQLAAELADNARFMKQDVSLEEDWINAISETESTFGPINVLVNNAGIVIQKSLADMSLAEYVKVININQVSIFLGMKYVLASMKKVNNGSIINISSVAGFKGGLGSAAYCSSKFAVRGLTQSAAVELASLNIRVNSIHPGAIQTPMLEQDDTKGAIKQLVQLIPLERVAMPREVTSLVIYLASDESSYCTGSEFVVDGGLLVK